MQRRSFKDQHSHPAAHATINDFRRVDIHFDSLALMDRTKARRRRVDVDRKNDASTLRLSLLLPQASLQCNLFARNCLCSF
jgi:hypothetical protein